MATNQTISNQSTPLSSSNSRSNLSSILNNQGLVNSVGSGGGGVAIPPANLTQIVRNPSNAFLTNNMVAVVSSSPSARLQNELLYTGL